MGPQHPSTHGVLRLVLELEGETVTQARSVIGYLHTGIEKSAEYRTWTQAVTFLTRADYLSPLFNEAAYCLDRGEAARHHRRGPGARPADPGPGHGAAAHRLPPDLAGHRQPRARRQHRHAVRPARARADPRHPRDDHRPADEPRLHPPRRRRPGPAARARSRRSASSCPYMLGKVHEYDTLLTGQPIWINRLQERRLPRPPRVPSRSASPARCCARRVCPGTCASSCPTSATRPTTSRS